MVRGEAALTRRKALRKKSSGTQGNNLAKVAASGDRCSDKYARMQCTVQPYVSCLYKTFSVKATKLKSCRQIVKESNPRPKKPVHLVLTKILLKGCLSLRNPLSPCQLNFGTD